MYKYDSRKINPGDTYICLPKGDIYIQEALKKGASDVLFMTRKELALFAHDYFGRPSDQLCVIGITGTNGKTTVAYLVSQALSNLGYKPMSLGTLNAPLTTPESWDTQCLMAGHLLNGGTHFVMEVSSHGIHQDRIDMIAFDIKLLTNITQDHLDYHQTMDAYTAVKYKFLNKFPGKSISPEMYQLQDLSFSNQLFGVFNKHNLKAASAILMELDISPKQIAKSLSTVSAPPGRFEAIQCGQPFLAIVDYAHTPDGLENVLQTAQEIARERRGDLYCVFGCGGDRDRKKRPVMGAIACHLADYVIFTDDNPRTEDPKKIMRDILEGVSPSNMKYKIEHDRKSAIQMVIKCAQPRDVILIAGKGHEDYQIIGHQKIPFDDRTHVRQYCQETMVKII